MIACSLAFFSMFLPFWAAPVLARIDRGNEIASKMLCLNPIFFPALPWGIDLLRLPTFYSNTPISQMFVRYPDSESLFLLWGSLNLALALYLLCRRRKLDV